ncbi:MAG TPA: DUF3108 domain-containing protein [Candidatus Binataceae bacterium]|nr:DUF3108 domain-containing protein [Candidatus Binataceae bacterium]
MVPIILAIIILFASLAGRAVASETPREVVETPTYTPGRIPFHPGQRLTYQVSWSGFPAAGATILMRPDDDNPGLLTGEINISTNKLVDVVYRMRDYVRENFNRSSLLPRDVYIKQSQNKRGDEYVIKFDHQAGVVDMVRHTPRKTEHVKFKSPNPLGPITGPLMALSQPLTPGDTLVFDVFVGENRYVIALKVEQRERLRTALGVFNTVRIKPTMMYVSNKAARDKAREVTVWVTDDERHLPLRVRAEAFIGYIIADLVQVAGIDLPESIDPSPATAGASPSPSASPTPTP